MIKKWYYASATIMGAVIGAGVLGIPFVFAKAGVLFGLINLVVVACLFLFVNLCLGEVMLRTKGIHQLSGYAEKYLGKKGKLIMSMALIFALYGALIAYLIGLGEVTSSLFGGQPFFYTTVFFIVYSILIYYGIKAVSRSEFFFSSIKILAFIALLVSIVAFFRFENVETTVFSVKNFFLPYGVVLFALLGFPALPEAREVLAGEEKDLKKAIMVAMIIPAAIYFLFGIFFVGALGKNISEVAVSSLNVLGGIQFLLGIFFAFLSLTTAYLSLGLALQEVYEYDYKVKHKLAFLLTVLVPYSLVAAGVKSFVKTLSLVGAIGGGIMGILIVLMFVRAKKTGNRTPEYRIKRKRILSWIIIALFTAGIIYEFIFFFS